MGTKYSPKPKFYPHLVLLQMNATSYEDAWKKKGELGQPDEHLPVPVPEDWVANFKDVPHDPGSPVFTCLCNLFFL